MSYIKQLQNNHSSLDNSIALIDCNNFYASCERIFNPKLMRRPIVVLSNNDGCIITRSAEAKKLGIKMGEPYFKAKKIIDKNNVKVFSSNYSLYGDISQRVMETLARFAPDIEIYSIDEAFLGLNGFENYELSTYCSYIRRTIKQWVGIPVSIGVSSTKTLSKIANNLAKKNKEYDGVCVLKSWFDINEALKLTTIEDVWGIGRRLSIFLKKYNINTAYDFTQLDKGWIKKINVTNEKKNSIGIKVTDGNGNIIETSKNGVSISAKKDIKINSDGKITLDGKKGINIKSLKNISLSGSNVSASAKAKFSAKGNSGADLTASGKVTIKGSATSIN